MDFDRRCIPQTAIDAVNEIIGNYSNGDRSSILFAQMQSGKTNAFLLLSGEMLRKKKIKNVVIFTGNREKELKKQLHSQIKGSEDERSFFDGKYVVYLESINAIQGMSHSEFSDLIQMIKNRIHLIWGTELNKKSIPNENTLFIHEESHYAQTVGQCPDKFLKKYSLPVNGNIESLEEKNNFVCSVSATPFSELCDNGNLQQRKKITRMTPGTDYRGVKWYMEHGKIIGFDNWHLALEDVLLNKKTEVNWGIVRVRGSEQFANVEQMCIRHGWDVKKYDQENSDIVNMSKLSSKPLKPTVVILRERCRMGTVVPKDYLSFVLETSKKPKTDTLLQGLLGRVCGYHTNNSLHVYIHNCVLKSGEIETYIDFCDGNENSVPNHATNIVSETKPRQNRKSTKTPVIPIHIPKSFISEQATFEEKGAVIVDILNALHLGVLDGVDDGEKIINENPSEITEKIIEELQNGLESPEKVIHHRLSYPTFKQVPTIILDAIEFRKTANLGSGCGVTGEQSIILYYVDSNIPKMKSGSYYLCCYLDVTEEEQRILDLLKKKKLPTTTGHEIFRYYSNVLENGDIESSNGGFCLSINPETSTNEEIMFETIRECVLRSKETVTCLTVPNKITSIRQPGFEKYTGIYVSLDVYNSLVNGRIYNDIKNEFNVEIKIQKSKGRPTAMPSGCIKRLSQISWNELHM